MKLDLDAAVRTLLLPLRPGVGAEYADRAEGILDRMGVLMDYADWVLLEASRWSETGRASTGFRRFVRELLYSAALAPTTFAVDVSGGSLTQDQVADNLASRYFQLHSGLMASEKIDHQEASRILSHAHTILLLASGGGMTASRIYGMMTKDGVDVGKGWSAVRTILNACGFGQEVKEPEVRALYAEDQRAEPELFGDLDLAGSIELTAEACKRFGYRGDLKEQLTTLIVDNLHAPYLCMVHFQLTAMTVYNHRITNAYEFEPRGQGLLWLSGEYVRCGLDVRESPFLNNAKSVDTLDQAWAGTKRGQQRAAARALADLLYEFDTLSDPSRSAGGRYIRCLLHRFIRLTVEEQGGVLPHPIPVLTATQIGSLCRGIAAGNTGTTGILEQRLTDAWLLHRAPTADWHIKGVGDSVFATNTSKKKFGDSEAKHRAEPVIMAVEAHGGHLTQAYVESHLSTMKRVLPIRLEELQAPAPLEDWTLDLYFVSHTRDAGLSTTANVDGLNVRIHYHFFTDIEPLGADPTFQGLVREHLAVRMNSANTPSRFREAAIGFI